jgi:hypothetical protein
MRLRQPGGAQCRGAADAYERIGVVRDLVGNRSLGEKPQQGPLGRRSLGRTAADLSLEKSQSRRQVGRRHRIVRESPPADRGAAREPMQHRRQIQVVGIWQSRLGIHGPHRRGLRRGAIGAHPRGGASVRKAMMRSQHMGLLETVPAGGGRHGPRRRGHSCRRGGVGRGLPGVCCPPHRPGGAPLR